MTAGDRLSFDNKQLMVSFDYSEVMVMFSQERVSFDNRKSKVSSDYSEVRVSFEHGEQLDDIV